MPTAQTWQTLCPGEKNRWFDLEPRACGGYRVLPHLYQFGANSFLLVSDRGAGMVVDPTLADIHQLHSLQQEIHLDRICMATAGVSRIRPRQC